MDSVSSDTSTSVFSSPDSQVETSTSVFSSQDSQVEYSNDRKFETSISVSSLAEKFEKSGDFSKNEEKSYSQCEIEKSRPLQEAKDSTESDIMLPSSSTAAKNSNSVCQNGSEIPTEPQTSNAIEERVSYFVNKIAETAEYVVSGSIISKDNPNTTSEDVAQVSTSEQVQNVEGVSKSLQHLEQSFINALHIAKIENREKTVDMLPVPCIQITEASDREDSSDDAEEIKPESKVVVNSVEDKVEDTSTTQSNDGNKQSTSANAVSEGEEKCKSDVSAEERKAVFYISSSDLPAEQPPQESEENNGSQQSSENVDERADSTRAPESNGTRCSCLRSKTCHGITFLLAFVIAIFGCILYGFAQKGKVPDYCEHLGLIIAIISGMIGAFSCFCYSCLEIFPGLSREGYERIPGTNYMPTLPPVNLTATANANAESLDDSWSSEKERAFRIANGMSSTRTSAASLRSELDEYLFVKKSEHQELVDKTEKFKKGVMELLDAFSAFMSKLEPIDKLVELESGMMNG